MAPRSSFSAAKWFVQVNPNAPRDVHCPCGTDKRPLVHGHPLCYRAYAPLTVSIMGAYEPPAPSELQVLLKHEPTFPERRPEASLSASNCRGMVRDAKSVTGPSEGSRACAPYHPGRRLR